MKKKRILALFLSSALVLGLLAGCSGGNDGGMSREDEARIARLLSPDYDMTGEPSGNIGIANVDLRLRILYGPGCGLTISQAAGGIVTARLTIALAGSCDFTPTSTDNK